MPTINRLKRDLTPAEEWGILVMWHKGFDTVSIATWLHVHESEIANRLMRLRDRQRQMVGGGNRA